MFESKQKHSSNNSPSSKPKNSLFIMPKLKVGQPGDKYEVEADRVADKIVANETTPFIGSSFFQSSNNRNTTAIGRQTEDDIQEQTDIVDNIQDSKEYNNIQTALIDKTSGKEKNSIIGIQTKEIAKTEDKTQEQEEELQESLQAKTLLQKTEDVEDEKLQAKANNTNSEAPSAVESMLNSSNGSGNTMPDSTTSEMESGFGADFSNVRIHTDTNAMEMNNQLNAQAFTHGNNIYFNANKYQPETPSGKHLLAHELTHTVQQGASSINNDTLQSQSIEEETIQQQAQPSSASNTEQTTLSLSPVDISNSFKPDAAMADYIDKNGWKRYVEVPVKLGKLASGSLKVKQTRKAKEGSEAKYKIANRQALPFAGIDFLNPLLKHNIAPVIALNAAKPENISGYVTLQIGKRAPINHKALIPEINKHLETLGLLGVKPLKAPSIENNVTNGIVTFKTSELSTTVGGFFEAGGNFGLVGKHFVFELNTHVDIKGLTQGDFKIVRNEKGQFTGEGEITTNIKNLSGKVKATYNAGEITLLGTVGIQSEKFSGSVTIMLADKAQARQTMMAQLGVETLDSEKKKKPSPKKAKRKTKKNQVIIGWGTVTATITPWLAGTAKVGIDDVGQVTIVGEIAVPNEVRLMEQKGKKTTLFDLEIKAGYGIPVVGQVGLFASIGMFINAGFGPLVLRDVGFTGTYSTDPSVLQKFTITGTLGISAFAIIGLVAKAGVFVTIISHDIKAGIKATAAAGIKAYAEVKPTFEYIETADPQGGKVGEAWLRGHFEAAAQLFLKLAGSFFVEVDAPWWSPVPDKTWDYPLGEVEYPIGPSMGIGGDVNWLVGSPELPELKFSPVDFDPSKFTSDIMADPPPGKGGGKGGEQKGNGKWEDKTKKGGKQEKPELKKNNKGLEGKKKEDLSKLPDEKRYMRALGEIGKLGDSSKQAPITFSVLNAKLNKIKQKYRINTIATKNKKDGNVKVFVKHAKQNNNKNLIKVLLMSEAEREKLINTAKKDLDAKQKAKADPKLKTIKESDAKTISIEISKKHHVVNTTTVTDDKETWNYIFDFGDKKENFKGFNKAAEKIKLSDEDIKKHQKIASEIKTQLEKTPTKKPKTFVKLYSIKKNESKELEKKYQNKLKPGIKIEINIKNIASDKKDNDFDFTINIKPNDTVINGRTILTPTKTEIKPGPTKKFSFKPPQKNVVNGDVASYHKATLLPSDPKIGSSTAGVRTNKELYDALTAHTKTTWKQGHLLNHDLGGLAEENNLFPITTSANSNHYHEVEKLVKHWIAKGCAVEYNITATKTSGNDSADGKFECKAIVIEGSQEFEGKVIHKTIHSATTITESTRLYKDKEKDVKGYSEVEEMRDNKTFRDEYKKLESDPAWSHK